MSAPSTIGSTIGSFSPATDNGSSNDLYWTSPDPRDTGIIGYEGKRPVFWRLSTTMAYHNATRTIIYKGVDESSLEEEVAWLDWTSVNHLGLATIGTLEVPMSELVKKGSTFRTSARSFEVPLDRRRFEWRRDEIFSSMHHLYSSTGDQLATFELYDIPEPSSIGPLYGVMRYWYHEDDNLMLTSIISLSLIRWISTHGLE